MESVAFKDVSLKINKSEILKNISFSLDKGESFSLMGQSGSGKTSILKLITGEFNISQGEIYIDGRCINHLPMQKRGAVLIAGENTLFPHMTLEENVFFAPKMQKNCDVLKINEIIEITGLEEHRTKLPCQLSMGQKQRGIIARALAVNPSILLLDEAFSSLDEKLKQEMILFMSDLKRKMGFTLLTATHDLEEALFLSNNMGFVEKGRLYTADSIEKILMHHKLKHYFGDMKIIKGHAENYVFTSDDGSYYVPCAIEKGRALFLWGKYHRIVIEDSGIF